MPWLRKDVISLSHAAACPGYQASRIACTCSSAQFTATADDDWLTVTPDGGTETVPVAGLAPGDEVLVRDGDAVPADGSVLDGSALLDESLLTGEFSPRRREPGDPVLAGSLNRGSPIRICVERTGAETLLSGVARLLERAQAARPRLARSADRVARWFVMAILATAATVFAVWWQLEPERAFEITLSVLVVTCPCALSLAIPAALSAATTRAEQLYQIFSILKKRDLYFIDSHTTAKTVCQPSARLFHLRFAQRDVFIDH